MLIKLLKNLFRGSPQVQKLKSDNSSWPGLESVVTAFQRKNYVSVMEQCFAALQQEARNVKANYFCGRALMELDRYPEAEQYLRAAVEADPGVAEANADLAEVLRKAGDLQSAEDYCRRAISIAPMESRFRICLVDILEELSRHQDALEELSLAQECAPDRLDVLERLISKLDQLGQYELALQIAERAISEIGETFETQFFLGYARFSTGDHLGAVEACKRAIKLRTNKPGVFVTLGSALLGLRRIDEAIAAFKRSLKVLPNYPDALFHLGMLNLMRGRYRDGWAGFEYRFKLPRGKRRSCEPRWNGTSLRDRTLHVLREQGLGDDIMYSSCYPQLINDAKHCVIECEPRLEKLFVRSFPQATFVPIVDNAIKVDVLKREDVDVRIFSASVPGYLRNSNREFPAHQGYLCADSQRVTYWRTKLDGLGGGLKIGISWKGGTVRTHRNRRTLSLECLLPLLSTSGVHWINLQYGDRVKEITGLKQQHGVEIADWAEAIDGDYDETAALVGALDLVISVCTSVIHLGGALGRPVWVMVPYAPEWRYGLEGESMPWYPSVRLRRQTVPDDWDPVIKRIREDLSVLLSAH